jgi:hypothetical protein
VSPLADARDRAEGEPGLTDTLYCLGSESVVALIGIGAYRVAATLTVVSCLHRHASPESTYAVETVQPRTFNPVARLVTGLFIVTLRAG